MRLIFLASGAFAEPTLRALAAGPHELHLVITQPARGSGRGRKRKPTPVRAVAGELGIEVLETDDVNSAEVEERIRRIGACLGVVVAFGQKLGEKFLSSMPGGCINLHASLLPLYRGAAPINWAIVRGEKTTGCTVFRIVERMDAGPILTTRTTTIKQDETAGELHDRLAVLGSDAVEEALRLFDGGEPPAGVPQDDAKATLAPKLKKAHGMIDFDRPARRVANHILGMTPWPGAFTRFQAADGRWEIVTITRVRVVSDAGPTAPPGTIDVECNVAASDGSLEILQLKPSSGREMSWPEYMNGRHVAAGDRFLRPES